MLWKVYKGVDHLFLFSCIREAGFPFPFLFESAKKTDFGRYSFFGAEPFLFVRSKAGRIEVFREGQKKAFAGRPFSVLKRLLEEFKEDVSGQFPPFISGAAGYLSYDLFSEMENINFQAAEDIDIWDMFFCFYPVVFAADRFTNTLFVFSSGRPEKNLQRRQAKARRDLDRWESFLAKACQAGTGQILNTEIEAKNITSDIDWKQYARKFEVIKNYLAKGDVYQVNFSQRFSAESDIEAFVLFERLLSVNPTDFSGFFDTGDYQIISNSPEELLRLDRNRRVITRPMKGTRPRGFDKAEDRRLQSELLGSLKENAELVMIVDLERNDLGRVCLPGSVKVNNLRSLESYNTVYQVTAEVEGRLRNHEDIISLLKAVFPSGSVTGAPKIRAVEIIDEVETFRRGIYTGSLGYIDFSGSAGFNIMIRTVLQKTNKLYFNMGGGILFYSDCWQEYNETFVKARSIFNALNIDENLLIKQEGGIKV